jgi:Fe-S-cluster-containing dehydrogenase component/DMSO reductase anchor subunit
VDQDSRTLIDDLLAEQSQLTAVDIFSRAHDAHAIRDRRYENLLPATAPSPGQQYAFEVDLDKCSGCKACVTACHSLNGLDDDETWRSVGELVSAEVRAPMKQTVTTACHHCVDPGCLNGCPVLAYDKDPITGIVKHLDDQCIGCQYCVMKCPYEVPQYSKARGIVRKCDMCSSRLAVGEAPACVQACPHEAIKITVVDQGRVRGKYRQLSTFNFQPSTTTTASPSENNFLPDSPNPAITLPTTRYLTNRTLPANLEAADAHEVRPAQAHPPLVFLLVLSQLGVGLTLLGALAGGRSRSTAIAALVVTLVAVNLGTLHLGQPLKAWRSFLGWRKSWFSRELIAFGIFIGALGLHCAILHPLSSILAAATGLAAVGCSAMIYVDTRRPFWNAPMTFGKFFGTTLLLGGVGTFVLTMLRPANSPAHIVAGALAALGIVVKLAAENRIFRFLVDEQSPHLDALNKTALLLTGRFGFVSRVRIACLVAGGIALLVTFNCPTHVAQTALFATAFTLCLVGEFIERHLFFVAEVAPKMPGGGTA